MPRFARQLALSTLTACFALTLGATPVLARVHHHKHHVRTHHTRRASKAPHTATIIRLAQQHLTNLGYYAGKIDGVMGPQTRTAIKNFQRDKGLKADGVLGSKTNKALEDADHRTLGTHSIPLVAIDPDAIANLDQDYTTPMNGGTKTIASRFGRVDVTETGTGADKRYAVNLNGQSVLTADNQPSVIGVSPTYDLGQEDAVVFTTYSPSDANCMYKNHVLAMTGSGTQMLDIDNCTRGYQASVNNGMLTITFPEYGDNRAIGATWRLTGTNLERL